MKTFVEPGKRLVMLPFASYAQPGAKLKQFVTAAVMALLSLPCAAAQGTAPHQNAPLGAIKRFPGDGTGAYSTGKYRDLLAEAGHTRGEQGTAG